MSGDVKIGLVSDNILSYFCAQDFSFRVVLTNIVAESLSFSLECVLTKAIVAVFPDTSILTSQWILLASIAPLFMPYFCSFLQLISCSKVVAFVFVVVSAFPGSTNFAVAYFIKMRMNKTTGHHRHIFLPLLCQIHLLEGWKRFLEKVLPSANFYNFFKFKFFFISAKKPLFRWKKHKVIFTN